jgi:tRNA (cytidine/uridine-2'-O-)-methyltransferase
VKVHPDLGSARAGLPGRCFAFSSRGTRRYSDVSYADDDVLVFGTERTGLRPAVIDGFDADAVLTIPMRPDNRSLNLANAVAIVVYEAWRQAGFAGSVGHGRHGLTSESLPSGSYDS